MNRQTKATRRPSMGDVANLAGVSTQTVSRVSNGEPYVSDEKREKVLAAMQQLGYRPNSAARAMKRGEFRTIGVIYHSLHPVGNHRSLEAISEQAASQGYATTIMPLAAYTRRGSDGAFTRLGEMNVDAIIAILPSQFMNNDILHLPTGIPRVILGPEVVPGASSLDFDQTIGSDSAVEHLLSLGHETVHHISGPRGSYSAGAREEAWRQTLLSAGKRVPEVQEGDWTPHSGYEAAAKLLETEQPTAIFVANDQMALGAYRALLERGLTIPGDVSVVGFDDIDESVEFPPPLTTVIQDWDLIGSEALGCALDLLKGGSVVHKTIPTQLILRDSTAAPK